MPRAFLLKSRSWEGQTTTEADVHHTEIAMERTCDEESGNVFGSFVNSRDPSVMTHKGHTGQVLSNSKLRICTNGAAYRLSEMATGEVLLPLRPLVQTKGQGRLLSPSGPRPIAGGRECVDVCSSTEDLIQYDMQTFGEGGPDMSRDKHVLSESQRTDDDDDDSCDEIDVMNNDDDDDIDVDICDVSGDDEVFAQEVNRRVINPDDVPESQVPQVIHKHSPFFESRDDLPTHLHQPEVSRNALQEGPPGGAAFHPEVHEHEVSHQSRRGQKTLNIIPVECLPSTQHFAPNHGQGVPNREPEEPSSTPEVRDTSPSDELRTPAGGHSDPEQRPPLTPSPPISEGEWKPSSLSPSGRSAVFGLPSFGLSRCVEEPCSRLSDESLPGDRSPGASSTSTSTSSPEARLADRSATLRPFSCTPPDVSPPSLLFPPPSHMRSLSHPPPFWPGVLPGLNMNLAPQNFLDLSFRRLQQLHYENSRRDGLPCRLFPTGFVRPALPMPLVPTRRPVVAPQVIHPLVPTQHTFSENYDSRVLLNSQVPNSFKPPHEAYKGHVIKPIIKYPIDADRRIPLPTEKDCDKKRRKDFDAPRFTCDGCGKSYSTFSGLSKHKQFHCTSHVKKQFSCKYCDKTYVSLGALKMHIRTHTLPCKCPLCGKAFSRPWLLQGHIRTHTGEKPFKCQHCARAFADRSNLRAHLQTHSDVKKYNCKTCAKTFSRMSLLLKHEDGGCSGSL